MVTKLRDEDRDVFDSNLKWIIFGKGGTHILQFKGMFLCVALGKHEDPEHPFRKV